MSWGASTWNLTRECPICGKKFIPEPLHAWKDKTDPNRARLVCTYPCMRESERRMEEKRAKTGRRYKRLNPEEMTEKQKRGRINRNSVKCSDCKYSQQKTVGGEDMLFCEHPDREYIYQNKAVHRGKNLTGMITVISENEKRVITPKWCPLKKGADGL